MLIKSHPSFEPFVPRRGLRGAHFQTVASFFLSRPNILATPEPRLFDVDEGAQVLGHCHWQGEKKSSLAVVIVHGLDGSSGSGYVLGTAAKAWRAGMNVIRMNMRNCGGTERLTPTLYHSGLSGDPAAVVRTLIQKDGLARIALVGFSMGANLVLNLLGEWGTDRPPEVCVAAAVSPLLDLAPSADALHHWSNRIYEWKFLLGLTRLYRRKARLFPGRFDLNRAKGLRSMRDFDEQIVAPYNGFQGADDYYARVSSSRRVEKIAVPTLVIHSQDDPFIRILPETRAKLLRNEFIQYLETEHGGHCAFLAAPDGYDGRWAERAVVEFLKRF